MLGLQWTVTDDSLRVCRCIKEEIEASITQGQVLSPVFSVFDPIGLFLTQQHCENKVEARRGSRVPEMERTLSRY